MIKNQKQYKITKAAAVKFKNTLEKLEKNPTPNSHPILLKAEKDGLRSQLNELNEELLEYENLIKSKNKVFYVNSLHELAQTLIKARISQNLSHKELAERLHLKEQQIQRYEATDYKTASLEKLKQISSSLNIVIDSKVFIIPQIDLNKIIKRLVSSGFSKQFIINTIFPSEIFDKLKYRSEQHLNDYDVISYFGFLSRFFKTSIENLILSSKSLEFAYPARKVSFKLSKNADTQKVNAQSFFATVLSQYILNISTSKKNGILKTDASTTRKEILKKYGKLNFETSVRYFWSIGIPVIPLRKLNSFHGACIRLDKENIIVLSQNTKLESRLHFDLFHEFKHSLQSPEESSLIIFEELDSVTDWQNTEDEKDANKFAADVLLNDRSEYLIDKIVTEAKGNIPSLKSATKKIAAKENIPVGALANYLAFRLSLQGINWWGTANNLQTGEDSSWDKAIEILFENVDLYKVEEPIRELLIRTFQNEKSKE